MYFTVFLIICVVLGVDQECHAGDPISCYHCLNKDEWCSDPFNETHPQLETIDCDGMCVKWVREPAPGKMTFTRTCSSRLNILMNIYHVCMRESRPAKGQICFCNTPHCNMAPHTLKMSSALMFISFLICLLFAGSQITNMDDLLPARQVLSSLLTSRQQQQQKCQHIQMKTSMKSLKHLSITYH